MQSHLHLKIEMLYDVKVYRLTSDILQAFHTISRRNNDLFLRHAQNQTQGKKEVEYAWRRPENPRKRASQPSKKAKMSKFIDRTDFACEIVYAEMFTARHFSKNPPTDC